MTPPEKIREIACHNCCCSFEDKSKANCRHYNNVWQMHEWDKEQFAKEKQQWIDKATQSYCENCDNIDCQLTECIDLQRFKEKLLKTIQL